MVFWKESMINRLSNLINRNRSAAKISQVLCCNDRSKIAKGPWFTSMKEPFAAQLFFKSEISSQMCPLHWLSKFLNHK